MTRTHGGKHSKSRTPFDANELDGKCPFDASELEAKYMGLSQEGEHHFIGNIEDILKF